jgi:hypothetical protein
MKTVLRTLPVGSFRRTRTRGMAPLPSSAQFDFNPTASIIHVSTSALGVLNKAVVNSDTKQQ